MSKVTLFFTFITLALSLSSQDVPFQKENFPTQKLAFEKAFIHFQDGNYEFDNAHSYCRYNLYPSYCAEAKPLYKLALKSYKEAYKFNPKNAELNFKMGICYFVQTKTDTALNHFTMAQKLNPQTDKSLLYFIGRCHQLMQNWDKALESYNNYLSLISEKKDKKGKTKEEVQKEIDACITGKKMSESADTSIKIINLGSKINSKYNDYSPVISKTGYSLLFTSKRPIPELDEETIDSLSLEADVFFEDIFISYQNNGEWMKQMHLNDLIRIRGDHYAVVGISDDGSSVLIYESNHGGDIYTADYSNGLWQGISKLKGDINSGNNEPSACYADGKKQIYFISNRSGGKGGKDIYITEKEGDEWGGAKNMGQLINTEFDEDGVFVSYDHQSLYFASNKPGGLGGYDIYKSVKDTAGNWTEPVNLGLPYNSPYDDIFFVLDGKEENAYFSSNRHGGIGGMDIYQAVAPSSAPIKNADILRLTADITLKGELDFSLTVSDAETKEPLECDIILVEKNSNDVLYYYHSDGTHKSRILNGTQYIAKIIADGYLAEEFEFTSLSGTNLNFKKLLVKQTDASTSDQIPDKQFEESYTVTEIEVFDQEGKPVYKADIKLIDSKTGQTAFTTNTGESNKALIQIRNGKEYKMLVKSNGYQSASILLNHQNLSEVLYIEAVLAKTSDKTKASVLNITKKQSFVSKGLLYDYQTENTVNGTIRIYDDSILVSEIKTTNGKFAVALPKGKIYQMEVTSGNYIAYSNSYSSNYTHNFDQIGLIPKSIPNVAPNSKMTQRVIPFEGYVSQFMTVNRVPATIEIYDSETGELLLTTQTDEKGHFLAALPNNRSYRIIAKAEGYISQSADIKLSKLSKKGIINIDLLSTADAVVKRNTEYKFSQFETGKTFLFSGKVQDYSNGSPITGSIEIFNFETNKLTDTVSIDLNGNFLKKLETGKQYYALFKTENYKAYTYNLKNIDEEFVYAEIKLMPAMQNIGTEGSAIVGNIDLSEDAKATPNTAGKTSPKKYVNIHFAHDEHSVKTEFEKELLKLAEIIKSSGKTVQLFGHTDSDGPSWYNQKLSEKRAQSVADFLIKNGVDKSKIKTKGLGESKPIAPNDTPQNKYLNRRVEVKLQDS